MTKYFETLLSEDNALAKPKIHISVSAVFHLINFWFWCNLRVCTEKTIATFYFIGCEKQKLSWISLQNNFQFNPFACNTYRTYIHSMPLMVILVILQESVQNICSFALGPFYENAWLILNIMHAQQGMS